jgi:hypothetical protein
MMGHMGISPMAAPPATPYGGTVRPVEIKPPPTSAPLAQTIQNTPSDAISQDQKRPADEALGLITKKTPRHPALRADFDPASSRRKRKRDDSEEETHLYFGPSLPHQPKTTALAVFSFLSNEDVYHSALVCKTWSRLAMDEELWKFEDAKATTSR